MQTIVLDACLLITLGNADSLRLLRDLPGWSAVTCPWVVAEVSRPPAAGHIARALDQARALLDRFNVDVSVDLSRFKP